MGKRAREIIGVDVNRLIDKLNKALADEWLAYYQYWIGSKVVAGPMRGVAEAELQEHAEEELKHAGMLVDRIIQLGGTPLLSPKDWYENTNCGYGSPHDNRVKKIVEQNLDGERCAIDVYKDIIDFIKNEDSATYTIVAEILEEELDHEQDLENILEDMDSVTKSTKEALA
ncbi:MAG: ferritin-like domain-containing protein [Elusimicrobiota bacterium]